MSLIGRLAGDFSDQQLRSSSLRKPQSRPKNGFEYLMAKNPHTEGIAVQRSYRLTRARHALGKKVLVPTDSDSSFFDSFDSMKKFDGSF